MTAGSTVVVSFADSIVHVRCEGPRARRVARFLFRSVASRSRLAPAVVYDVRDVGSSNQLALFADGIPCGQGSEGGIALTLLNGVGYYLVKDCGSGLALHAGVMVTKGCATLFPGTSGAGKTTLMAWLAAKQHAYMTDELAFVPVGSRHVHGLTRPLGLKTPSIGLLARLGTDFDARPGRTLPSPEGVLARHETFGRRAAVKEAPLERIVFPGYRAGARLRLTPLTPAQASLRLMACLVNARNLARLGLSEVTRLAASVPAQTLTYGSLRQLDGWIEQDAI